MRDWEALVERQLAGLALEPAERAEVIAELATHLAETCEELCRQGMTEEEAAQRALSQVEDWQQLRQRIQTAKTKEGIVTNRVTQLWLPGLLTFALSMGLLGLVQKFGPRPIILNLDKGTPVLVFYTSWLLTLPLAGAIGAFLSKRAGGSPRMLAISSVFPVLPLGVVFLIAIPVGLLIDHNVAHHIVAAAFLNMTFGWVLVPGMALLSGGLLVQLLSRRSGSPGVTVN